jgi:hypothetical protein
MAAPAILTQGTTFSIDDDAGNPVTINGIQSMTGLGSAQANKIDVTTLASTRKEYRMGLADWGDFQLTFIWNLDDLGQAEMLDACDNQSTRTFIVTMPATDPVFTKNVATFEVIVLNMQMDINADGVLQGTANLAITGDIVFS